MKTFPKKLRGGPTIQVDSQILRWRTKMAREGKKLGDGMRAADRKAERERKRRETDTDEKILATFKKRFGN